MSSIIETSSSIRWIFKIVGVAYISIDRNIWSNILDALLFATNFALLIYFIVSSEFSQVLTMGSQILTKGLQTLFVISNVTVLTESLLNFTFFRRRLQQIVLDLHYIDKLLSVCAVPIPHRQHRRWTLYFLAVLGVQNAFLCASVAASFRVYCSSTWSQTMASFWYATYRLASKASLMSIYGFSLLAIQQRMSHVNRALGLRSPSVAERLACVRTLRRIHAKLTDICDECNACLAGPMMAFTGIVFGLLLLQVFLIYKTLSAKRTTDQYLFIALLSWWDMYFAVLFVMVVAVGSRMTRDGRRTGCLVHVVAQRLNRWTDADEMRELMLFEQQVLHRVPVASCGLFVFDWTLVFSVG